MSRAGVDVTGVVAALRSEARCLLQPTRQPPIDTGSAYLKVCVSGMGCTRAGHAALRLVREGAQALLCFGVAGALDPSLRCGDVILASEVICAQPLALQLPDMRPSALPAQARLRTSESWRAQLGAALLHHRAIIERPVLTSAELICDTQRKTRLFRQTGAVAVDMESAAVGIVASLHALPFMVLRVVADTAEDALPEALSALIGPNPAAAPSWMSWLPLLAAPAVWPGLLRMGRRYQLACGVLAQCARDAWPAHARERLS